MTGIIIYAKVKSKVQAVRMRKRMTGRNGGTAEVFMWKKRKERKNAVRGKRKLHMGQNGICSHLLENPSPQG